MQRPFCSSQARTRRYALDFVMMVSSFEAGNLIAIRFPFASTEDNRAAQQRMPSGPNKTDLV
jgi:hypothetical protein